MAFDLERALGQPGLTPFLEKVEQQLIQSAANSGIFRSSIERIPSGKRLRPALVFASANFLQIEINESMVTAAAAIELVHLASLVHDDIIDDSMERRGVPTVYAREGLHHALLVGDFLFATAYKQAAQVNAAFATLIADTILTLCNGEALELQTRGNLERTEQSVLGVMQQKTAALIAAACQAPAVCAGQDNPAISKTGEIFGMAFQLLDDLLDFVGKPEHLGKPIGGDILEKNYTLPIVWAYKILGSELKSLLDSEKPSIPAITSALESSGVLYKTWQKLYDYVEIIKTPVIKNLLVQYLNWAQEELIDPTYAKIFTARAATSPTVDKETSA